MSQSEVVEIKDRRKEPNPYRKPFLIVIVAVCLSLLAQSVGSWIIFDVARDTNKIVNDIDIRNSPETQAQQQEFLEEIITRLDCNSRKAIEEALNDIADENPESPFVVDITTGRCNIASSE